MIVLLAALAACGDGNDGPGPTPTPSTTAAPSITPFPTATPVATPTGGPGTFPIVSGLDSATGVAAAWGGDGYLVTFGDQGNRTSPDVFGIRLTPDGAVDGSGFLLSDFGDSPFLGPDGSYFPNAIAASTTEFGVFLYGTGEIPAGPPGQVVGFARVPFGGAPILPTIAIDEQASFSMAQTALASPIAATSNGTLFLGIYQRVLTMLPSISIRQVVGQIVTVDGGVVQAQEIGPFSGMVSDEGVGTTGSAPGVAIRNDSTAMVAWVETVFTPGDPTSNSTRVQSVLLTDGGATFVTLAETTPLSQGVAVASDGEGFLVVWQAPPAGSSTLSELHAIRFTPGESPTPEGGFVLAGGSMSKALTGVAFAGGVYLVTWIEDDVLRGARLGVDDEQGQVFTIDAGPAASAALATGGERFLVVFDRTRDDAGSDVLGGFVPID